MTVERYVGDLAIAIYFGLTERGFGPECVYRQGALAFVVLCLLGGLIDIPIAARRWSVHQRWWRPRAVGSGWLSPLIALIRVRNEYGRSWPRGWRRERVWSGKNCCLPTWPLLFDPTYLFAGAAGLVAYLLRSRRAALSPVYEHILAMCSMTELIMAVFLDGRTRGAGIFDSCLERGAGVAFAEILGETRNACRRPNRAPRARNPLIGQKGRCDDKRF